MDYRSRMRWERLFGELENALSDETKLEHESLASELRDEEWAATAWTDLLGGTVELSVRGHGRIRGHVEVLGPDVLAVGHHVVRLAAIESVASGERAGSPEPTRYSWRIVMRTMLETEGSQVQVTTLAGTHFRGELTVLGADHIVVGGAVVPWQQVALVTGGRW